MLTSKAQLNFMKAIANGTRKETNGVTKEKAKEFMQDVAKELPERKHLKTCLPVPGRKR